MAKPRTVKVLSTQYYDILFSQENETTAKLLASKADSLFLQAKQAFNCKYDFRTIVIISPDSDTLSVRYTASPYNRIVVFDSVGRVEDSTYSNGLIDLFYHEIARSVSQSVRTEFLDFFAQYLLGDAFQPAALFNVPFSFLEGAVYTEDKENNTGLLEDNWNLQLLMQAKIENKFPSLLQVSGAMDIYPANDLCFAAAAAFYAYIQQKYGIEKFGEYWQECGKVNFLKLEKKIFKNVYQISLEEAWNSFIKEIPVPQNIASTYQQEKSTLFLKTDYDSNYKFVVSTNYGLVWYDELKGEVDISGLYDLESIRQLLFLASGVTNLTVSPCGRFLAVSYIQQESRVHFENDVVRIYDLKQRKFLSEIYDLRDGAIIELENGSYAVIGNSVNSGYSTLQAYESKEINAMLGRTVNSTRLVYSRSFDYGITPFTPVALNKNHFACLICQKNEWSILLSDVLTKNLEPNSESLYKISNGNIEDNENAEYLKIRNLRFADYTEVTGNKSDKGKAFCLLYDFVLQKSQAFTRTGWLFFDTKDNFIEPVRSIISSKDYYGGMSCGVMDKCKMYYVSNFINHSEIHYVDLNDIPFEEACICKLENNLPFQKDEAISQETSFFTESFTGNLDDINFQLSDYSPWKYMKKGSFKFFFPVRDINLEKGVIKEPGLGFTFETQADPFSNNELLLSVANGFIPLDFTKLFNASKKTNQTVKAEKTELSKDSAAAVYFENTSTPADIILASIFKFNDSGEYTFNAFANIKFDIPCPMTFRRFTFDLTGSFLSSTTYWDATQVQLFPNLYDWPSFNKSYRMWQSAAQLSYSNIHQYGLSPMKKLGISGGAKVTSSWGWGEWNPFQINMGLFATGEIPFLAPIQNYKNMILSLPTEVHAELFYTNGKAVEAYAQTLVFGYEIQNGAWRLYFPRIGLYTGYDIALEYNTLNVKLPDLRHLDRFYDVFGSCYLNDSFYIKLDFGVTPVVGKFSTFQMNTFIRLDKYLQTDEYKLRVNIEIKY